MCCVEWQTVTAKRIGRCIFEVLSWHPACEEWVKQCNTCQVTETIWRYFRNMTIFVACCRISYLGVFDMRVSVSHVQRTTSLPGFCVPTARETHTHRPYTMPLETRRWHCHAADAMTHSAWVVTDYLINRFYDAVLYHGLINSPTGNQLAPEPNSIWGLTFLRSDSMFEDGIFFSR